MKLEEQRLARLQKLKTLSAGGAPEVNFVWPFCRQVFEPIGVSYGNVETHESAAMYSGAKPCQPQIAARFAYETNQAPHLCENKAKIVLTSSLSCCKEFLLVSCSKYLIDIDELSSLES